MKYGLVYYHHTENVGDDILSYAAKQFLPQTDYYIDREQMNLFVPDRKEYVSVILNGWYLHHTYEFPPSPYLHPLFIGTHFSRDNWIFGDYSYLDGIAAECLKASGPIGCRDQHTREILTARGIDCYFSGCLTLTLQKYPDIAAAHTIVLTDVSDPAAAHIRALFPDREIIRMTHLLAPEEIGADWPSREARVEAYLKTYQAADLVITPRLHCALPSIALGTPVLLIGNYNEDFQIRLSDYSSYCLCCSENDLSDGKMDEAVRRAADGEVPQSFGSGPAPSDLAERLAERCRSFIRTCSETGPDISRLPEPSLYRELYTDRTLYMRRSIEHLIGACRKLEQQHIHDLEVMNQILATTQKVFEMK